MSNNARISALLYERRQRQKARFTVGRVVGAPIEQARGALQDRRACSWCGYIECSCGAHIERFLSSRGAVHVAVAPTLPWEAWSKDPGQVERERAQAEGLIATRRTQAEELPPGWGWSPMWTGVLFRATVDIVTPLIYWPGEWYWHSASSRVDGYAPTMLQAMCAALGISIAQHEGEALTGPYATARVGPLHREMSGGDRHR